MSEVLRGLDMAWEQVVDTRAQGDASAEARALSLLEQALRQEGRDEEADEIGTQVVDLARRCPHGREILQPQFEIWMRLGEQLEERAWGSDLYAAHEAYLHALMALDALADAPGPLREEVLQRAYDALLRSEDPHSGYPEGGYQEQDGLRDGRSVEVSHLAETIIVGFLAVKVLGPFLEEWARKLGEQLGESTVRALGRIRVRHGENTPQGDGTELEASVPGTSEPTTLVLPDQLSDSAKLAIIDLDPAGELVRGKTLYWSERDGAFLSLQERFTAFRHRHPEVTVSDGGHSASWSDDHGPHTISCGSMGPVWLIGSLEAKFDR